MPVPRIPNSRIHINCASFTNQARAQLVSTASDKRAADDQHHITGRWKQMSIDRTLWQPGVRALWVMAHCGKGWLFHWIEILETFWIRIQYSHDERGLCKDRSRWCSVVSAYPVPPWEKGVSLCLCACIQSRAIPWIHLTKFRFDCFVK